MKSPSTLKYFLVDGLRSRTNYVMVFNGTCHVISSTMQSSHLYALFMVETKLLAS